MTPEEIKKVNGLLREQAQLQQKVSGSFEGYMAGMKDLKGMQEERNELTKIQIKLQEELNAITDKNSDEWVKTDASLQTANEELEKLNKQAKALGSALANANKYKIFGGKAGAESVKLIGSAFGMVQANFNKLKGYGLFKMDKAMKMSALSMGILSKQTEAFDNAIKSAALKTNMIGFSLEDAAQAQATYSDELGRTVMLGEQGLVAVGQMTKALGLSAEEGGKLAASFENQGLSAERTAGFIEESLNDSHKMGLNASKVIKNIQGGIKLLNKYNFKDGTKGLEKMAKLVTKLGVDMEFATGFADKLWNVEGAVEMSAQLQVMGGQWAQLADPFELMYKARNDMEGLTEEIANAAAASAKFNAKTGEFDISAQEMHRLKIIADQTGLSYDELAKAGKNAAKFSKIKGQASFDFGSGPEAEALKEFVTNTAELDEKGQAKIMVGVTGEKKLLSQLTATDKQILIAQIEEKKTMAERAKAATTFDEQVEFLINQLKVLALPLVKVMNDKLIPKLGALSDRLTAKGGLGEKIMYLAEKLGELISWGVGFVIDNPIKTLMLYLTTKALPIFFDMTKWFQNGKMLWKGFTAAGGGVGGAGGPGGPGTSAEGEEGSTSTGGPKGKGFKGKLKSAGKGALGGLAMGAANMAVGAMQGEDVFSGGNIGNMIGSVLGGAAGTFLDPFIGPLGTLLGAQLGGMLGTYVGELFDEGAHDAYSAPKLGSDFSQGRSIMEGGRITPIDNKDELMVGKQGGPVQQAMKDMGGTAGTTKIEFGTLTVSGTITLQTPGNPGAGEDLMKNPDFKRDITAILQSEIEKNRNFGKNRG